MMAASMGPNFNGHPAGMGHPAVAGHALAPGMPPNAGQQGAPGGGMPHQFAGHVGVPPGGQMNPAMMAGMPPGANPGMHPGMQHMTQHQQQQLFQQQQHHLQAQMNNPQALASLRQHQIMQQQRQQAMMAQQLQMQQGMQMAGMQFSPQQLQQIRAQAARMQPGGHQQAMIAQQLQLQQQQQQAQQQAQQAQQAQQQQQQQQQHGGPQGQIPGGPQQGQGAPMGAQVHNMQQGQMGGGPQGQNPGQQQQGQQGPQGQPQGPQGQQQQQSAQQNQPQNPQQGSQAGTPGPTGQQTPAQTPAATPAQTSQAPQAGPNPALAQAHGQPNQQGQVPPPSQQQTPLNPYSMMPTTPLIAQQQQRSQQIKTQCMIKVMQFCEGLSAFPGSQGKDDLSYWVQFVHRFFSLNGVLRHHVHSSDSDESSDKQYEITYPAIARYFHTHFSSGVRVMQLMLDKVLQEKPLPNEGHFVEYGKSSLVYWFDTGSHLVARGTLRLQFDENYKLDLFEFLTREHEEYVSRKQVIEAAKPAHAWLKEWHKVNSDNKQSPEMTKKGKAKGLKSPQTQPPADVLGDLPHEAVTNEGLTLSVLQFLEVVEVMGQMNPLFGFYQTNPGLAPYSALEQYVATQINSGPHPTMNGAGQPPGPGGLPRTPSFGNFMGQSPGPANLPGSPHIGGSPAPGPGQMQAPNMALQASQQGTSSSGPSANTSPASNKRRRPSGVKTEDADASGTPAGVNGVVRGKPATPRMQKRAKTNAS